MTQREAKEMAQKSFGFVGSMECSALHQVRRGGRGEEGGRGEGGEGREGERRERREGGKESGGRGVRERGERENVRWPIPLASFVLWNIRLCTR